MWTTNRDGAVVGDVVFVGEICPQGRDDFFECRLTPYCTNSSLEARISGWVGETNNVSRFARGVGVVTRVIEDENGGERALVRKLRGSVAQKAFIDATAGTYPGQAAPIKRIAPDAVETSCEGEFEPEPR